MGIFDFAKKKEFAEIEALKNSLSEYVAQVEQLNSDLIKCKKECESYYRFKSIVDLESEKELLVNSIAEIKKQFDEEKITREIEIEKLNNDIKLLLSEALEKKKEVIELDEKILLQEFGFYKPIFDFANSEQYKDRIDAIRTEQKNMILNKRAATCEVVWSVEGSEAKGRAMTEQNIKQIIRSFNNECDVLVSKVKFSNITSYIEKLWKSFEQLNRINSKNRISISTEYAKLKADEIQLAFEYAQKKQEEKEEQRAIREQMREEARLQREIEEARKELEKEKKHYSNALDKINKQISESLNNDEYLFDKKKEIENHLNELNVSIQDIDYREANKKAGYVYVISNIGSFGEGVYKIGMTRRLEPMDRVDELGDASVPFKFDVHAMIFSDDAPKLEAALHRAFDNKKLNMVNNRREFFRVTLDEIEEVVKANYDKTVEFNKTPQAEQYRESMKIIEMM